MLAVSLECLDLPSKQQTSHFSSYHYVCPLCMCAGVCVCMCVCVCAQSGYHNLFAYACVCTSVKCAVLSLGIHLFIRCAVWLN